MNADTLARLTREAEAPEGIAVRVSGPEMKRLLEERRDAGEALRKAGALIALKVRHGTACNPDMLCTCGLRSALEDSLSVLARMRAP